MIFLYRFFLIYLSSSIKMHQAILILNIFFVKNNIKFQCLLYHNFQVDLDYTVKV